MDLAARRAVKELEGQTEEKMSVYREYGSEAYERMVERIRERLGLSTLSYQKLDDLVAAIGLPKEKLCTYCWDGEQ
jgi:amidophosphoribosyltransferase